MLDSLIEEIPVVLLVIFRIGGLMIYGPVFGAPVIPVRIKVLLAFVLGLAVYPALPVRDVPPPALELFTLAPLVARELMIGLVVGYAASLPLVAMQVGGLLMGQQMGLGFARFFNPAIDDDADVLGQVLFFTLLAAFLMVGGHEAMVRAVLESFRHVPLGGFAPGMPLIDLLTGLLAAAMEVALRVAAPVLCLIFLQTVAMGFVAKTVPQLNILSLGFALRIMAGLLMVMLSLVVIEEVMMEVFEDTLHVLVAYLERFAAAAG